MPGDLLRGRVAAADGAAGFMIQGVESETSAADGVDHKSTINPVGKTRRNFAEGGIWKCEMYISLDRTVGGHQVGA